MGFSMAIRLYLGVPTPSPHASLSAAAYMPQVNIESIIKKKKSVA